MSPIPTCTPKEAIDRFPTYYLSYFAAFDCQNPPEILKDSAKQKKQKSKEDFQTMRMPVEVLY